MTKSELIEKLNKIKEIKQLTSEELAKLLGVSNSSISKWLYADNMPELSTCRLINLVYNLTIKGEEK